MNVVADAAVNSLLAQRIEQGIGRGTRGGGDYCVIVLVGSKLVGWIGRKKNLDFLTASTRVQLRMGQEVRCLVMADSLHVDLQQPGASRMRQNPQRLGLDLSDSLAGDAVIATDQRGGASARTVHTADDYSLIAAAPARGRNGSCR